MTSFKSFTSELMRDDAWVDDDSTALTHRLMAEHERGFHGAETHAICPLCRQDQRPSRPACRLRRVQAAVARVVDSIERGLNEFWVTDAIWDAKEALEESAGLMATPRFVDPHVEVLHRERLVEVQHSYNLLAQICEVEEPLAEDFFWDSLVFLRRELTGGPELPH